MGVAILLGTLNKIKMKTPPKTGLFIDKSPDTEIPETVIPATEEGGEPTVVPASTKPGEWFYTLVSRNGNVIAENTGLNTSQSAMKTIRAVRNFFAKNRFTNIYNRVTGELTSLNRK